MPAKKKRTETVKHGGTSQYPLLYSNSFDGNLNLLLEGLAGYVQEGYKLPTVKLKELAGGKIHQVMGCFSGAESSGQFSKEGEYDEYILICELATCELYVMYQNNAATQALAPDVHFAPFNTGEKYKGYEIWGVTLFEPLDQEGTKPKTNPETTHPQEDLDDIDF